LPGSCLPPFAMLTTPNQPTPSPAGKPGKGDKEMSAIKVRVMNTRTAMMHGWSKTGQGRYAHESRLSVIKREAGRWEVVGGAQDGSQWQTMHWAMYQATK